MKQNITNKNTKGEEHGYQEWYHKTYYKTIIENETKYTEYKTKLGYRTNYKNGEPIGYDEWHIEKLTQFHIR